MSTRTTYKIVYTGTEFILPHVVFMLICPSRQILEKTRYGPIYRNGMNAVSVSTAKLLEEVLRNDDKFPNRGDMSIWKEYRDLRGYGYGPFTE